jgi:predicted metal-dependent hydrolase
MSTVDIYDEEKIARMLHVQRAHVIDFSAQIEWSRGVDLNCPLLPLDSNAIAFPEASDEQRLVISQLMGLIVASTIAELEEVACKLKGPCWEKLLRKFPVNPELFELGELFFDDEKKHSMAFNRYIELFANKVNVAPEELKALLPSSQNSFSQKIYHLNSLAGGMAMWWLIAAVEEESLLIHDLMRPHRSQIDPLYYNIHRCHFEEEIRHKSYAQMMLQVNNEMNCAPQALLFKKLDFMIAEMLNLHWTFNQLFKVRNLKALKGRHEFFEILAGIPKRSLFSTSSYVKSMLQLSEHQQIKLMLERFGAKSILKGHA